MPSQDSSRDYDLLDRLVEEFNERFRKGERPTLEEYCDRHPELVDDLRELLPALAQVEQAKDELAQEVEALAPTAAALQHLGDFRILREVGRGGVGVVYEAEQVSLGRRVALKVLTDRMMRDARQKQRFEREARAAARLHHTNIVPIFGAGEAEGVPYYVMQFIQGMGLDAVVEEMARTYRGAGVSAVSCTDQTPMPQQASLSLERVARSLLDDAFPRPDAHAETAASQGQASLQPAFPRQSVARIGIQVADALEYAHKQGVVHRDIKPSNLLLDLNGTVWVTDFGLAKAEGGENLTHTGDILGTLRYVPPEAFDGKADSRGDVYSLGLTLYELVALRPAFDQRDRNRLVKQVTTAEVQPLGTLRRGVPRDLETIIHKAIDRDPARRYQSAAELRDDLQRFVDDEPIRARRQTLLERYVRWARHNPAIAVLGAVLTAVLVLTTAASLIVAERMSEMYQKEARRAAVDRKALEVRTKIDRADAQIAEGDLHWKAGRLAEWRQLSHQGTETLLEAVRLAPSDSLEQRLGTTRGAAAHLARADRFAEVGLWTEAAAEFGLALEHVGYDAKHDDEDIWWEAGLTFLVAGNQDRYHHCVKEGLRLRGDQRSGGRATAAAPDGARPRQPREPEPAGRPGRCRAAGTDFKLVARVRPAGRGGCPLPERQCRPGCRPAHGMSRRRRG